MNIKFGMDNFFVRYLKRFLNHELNRSTSVLGKFEKADQIALLKYLHLPNTKTIFEVQQELFANFEDLNSLFIPILKDDEIQFLGKSISSETSEFLQYNINSIEKYCNSVGWKIKDVSSWINLNYDINNDGKINEEDRKIISNIIENSLAYDIDTRKKADLNYDGFVTQADLDIFDAYINNNKLYFSVQSEGRNNYFPNEDMLVFINQFDGSFLYNCAIREEPEDEIYAENPVTDVIHENTSGKYKIGIYECKPRSKINHIS